jgi:hypothetical protein
LKYSIAESAEVKLITAENKSTQEVLSPVIIVFDTDGMAYQMMLKNVLVHILIRKILMEMELMMEKN